VVGRIQGPGAFGSHPPAAQQNRDVRIAAERLRAARGGEAISRSWLFPTVGVGADAFDHKTNYDSVLKNFVPEAANTRAAQGAVGVTWEVDLFGRLRAGAAAAAADTLAVENGVRGVRLLVLSDVAANYFTLKGALKQLETVRAISAAQDETARLVTARQRVGLATPFDVERAQTEASRARAAIPPLETLAAASRHRIAVLIGGQAFNAATHRAVDRRAHGSASASGPACRVVAAAAGPARRKRAARRRERPPATGDGRVVPAALSRRSVRP
jgi:outer membrane protein TolC